MIYYISAMFSLLEKSESIFYAHFMIVMYCVLRVRILYPLIRKSHKICDDGDDDVIIIIITYLNNLDALSSLERFFPGNRKIKAVSSIHIV